MDNPLLTPCTDYLNEIPKSEDEIKLLMNIPNVSNLLDYFTLFVSTAGALVVITV